MLIHENILTSKFKDKGPISKKKEITYQMKNKPKIQKTDS